MIHRVVIREEVVYSSKTYYYFAIAEDLVLRLGWAAKLILTEFLVNSRGRPLVEPTVVTSVLAFLEMIFLLGRHDGSPLNLAAFSHRDVPR